ncbi:MAG: tRNA uridine-5-carboxymethylaminomethyl(34) synthesis GTPase MnmE [Nitratireductor sp.]
MDTIFALSSGMPPSGLAVIRLSGPKSRFVLETISGKCPEPKRASLRKLRGATGSLLDEGLVLWFPGPGSFTGEDSCEFHVHGGRAVVAAVLDTLNGFEGLRLAEPGEFSRRAFSNGRIDLTEVEGLADLVNAQTEAQRRQAIERAGGSAREVLENWRSRVIRMRALLEADFDFADEEDVPGSVADNVWEDARALAEEIRSELNDQRRGEIIRDGYQIVVMGPPNAGKSSLINALARRDIAIVTPEAGTTRDLLEVHLDLDGYAVTIVDTAGIREISGLVEREGIKRAKARAALADLVVWLDPDGGNASPLLANEATGKADVLVLHSKDDAGLFGVLGLSVKRDGGLDHLLDAIRLRLLAYGGSSTPGLVTQLRHRKGMEECAGWCAKAAGSSDAVEIRSEYLRRAADEIGKLTGRIGVDDLLDVIFGEFCIGK